MKGEGLDLAIEGNNVRAVCLSVCLSKGPSKPKSKVEVLGDVLYQSHVVTLHMVIHLYRAFVVCNLKKSVY
jgi:hypothetical protein